MNTVKQWKAVLLMMASALIGTPTIAQPRHLHHYRPVTVITIATHPASAPKDGYSQKARLDMAVKYLKTHKYITIKKYAKTTKISKSAAEAELDSFSKSKRTPIKTVIRKGKKVYTLG